MQIKWKNNSYHCYTVIIPQLTNYRKQVIMHIQGWYYDLGQSHLSRKRQNWIKKSTLLDSSNEVFFYAYQPYNRRIYATLSNFYQIKLRKRLNVAIKNGFAFLAKTTIAQKQHYKSIYPLGEIRGDFCVNEK